MMTGENDTPAVAGFRGAVPDLEGTLVKLGEIADASGVRAQLLNADLVYGPEHILAAFNAAARALARGRSRASELAVELVRYAAGQRQIGAALSKMGVGEGAGDEERIACVLWPAELDLAIASGAHSLDTAGSVGGEGGAEYAVKALEEISKAMGWVRDDGVLPGDARVLQRHGFKEAHLRMFTEEQYQGLILERVAMADLRK